MQFSKSPIEEKPRSAGATMGISEHILALMSIVVGLAMTQLLSGAGGIVQYSRRLAKSIAKAELRVAP